MRKNERTRVINRVFRSIAISFASTRAYLANLAMLLPAFWSVLKAFYGAGDLLSNIDWWITIAASTVVKFGLSLLMNQTFLLVSVVAVLMLVLHLYRHETHDPIAPDPSMIDNVVAFPQRKSQDRRRGQRATRNEKRRTA